MVYVEPDFPQFKTICPPNPRVVQKPWTPHVRKKKIAAEVSPKFVNLQSFIGSRILEYSTKKAAPAYHIGRKYKQKLTIGNPSPAAFDLTGLSRRGKAACNAPTIRGLPERKQKPETPGPFTYIVDDGFSARTIPQYTFGYKRKIKELFVTPGPDVFKIASLLGGSFDTKIKNPPSFTMRGRGKAFFDIGFKTPSPVDYTPVDPSKRNYPKYSFRDRYHEITTQKHFPGAGYYCPERVNVHKTSPAFTFLMKHSKYLGVRKAHEFPTCIEYLGKPFKYY
ncbi:outer dense fiber protein 3-like [Teleopsis dalmanni]|uniref:outer dense fiber protein 3-like n=1 Tax=Teleopsis dalmanni TaxID=139649 RepID=UPI0018CDA46E|nr:outer dense fiber protein 3-like [Teleopsis dalmanni]